MDKLLLTAPEAARALGISRSKLYELLRDGEIRSVRIGRSRRVPWAALGAYVASLAETDGLELGVTARP
jgi:excisionase family DNA binding protein